MMGKEMWAVAIKVAHGAQDQHISMLEGRVWQATTFAILLAGSEVLSWGRECEEPLCLKP